MNKDKLVDKVIGRWKVLCIDEERTYKTKRKYYICECQCEKHTIKSVRADTLGKRSTSCGCIHKEKVEQFCKENLKKYNTYNLNEEYGIGYTLDGKEFYFDKEDYDKIKNYCWSVSENGYLVARESEVDCPVLMHRIIFNNLKNDDVIDHIGHNTLDNRKMNLRICRTSQNAMNKKKSSRNTSGHPGVSWKKDKNKWEAYIGINGKIIHLGTYKEIEEAVRVRKNAEEKYFKNYSYDRSMEQYDKNLKELKNCSEKPLSIPLGNGGANIEMSVS